MSLVKYISILRANGYWVEYAGLAHLVERLLPKQKVASSSLVTRSTVSARTYVLALFFLGLYDVASERIGRAAVVPRLLWRAGDEFGRMRAK